MDTKISCPNCGQHILVDSTAIGQQAVCPTCSTPFTIAPVSLAVPPSPPPPTHKGSVRSLWVAAAGVACVIAAAAGIWFLSGGKNRQASPSVPVSRKTDAPVASNVSTPLAVSPTAPTPEESNTATWDTDWNAFANTIERRAFDPFFIGKEVKWTGTITELESPKNPTEPGTVRILMGKAAKITKVIGTDQILLGETDTLTLIPSETEWPAWSTLQIGQKVMFRTTLSRSLESDGVVATLQMASDMQTRIWIGTKDATLISVGAGQLTLADQQTKPKVADSNPLSIAPGGRGVVCYHVAQALGLRQGEWPALIVFLSRGDGPVLDERLTTAKDKRGGPGLTGQAVVTREAAVWFAQITASNSDDLAGYRLSIYYDTSSKTIQKDADLKISLDSLDQLRDPSPFGVLSEPSLNWAWLGSEAKVSAALAAFKTEKGNYVFNRFLGKVAIQSFKTQLHDENAPGERGLSIPTANKPLSNSPAANTRVSTPNTPLSSPSQTGVSPDPQARDLLKLLSLCGSITKVSTSLNKNGKVQDNLLALYLDPNSTLNKLYREKLGITVPPAPTPPPLNSAVRLPEVVNGISSLSLRPENIEAFPSKNVSFKQLTSTLGTQFQRETTQEVLGDSFAQQTCTWFRYGRWSFGGITNVLVIRIFFADSPASVAVQPFLTGKSAEGNSRVPTQDTPASISNNWPGYSGDLVGGMEVRVKNPNEFGVKVGLRSAGKGKDFVVEANDTQSVQVPNGRYDIYFQYSTDPDGLYQGDSFTLNDNGVEIQIVKVVNGNYGIRRVK